MLLAIAVCPLWIPQWWERNLNKFLVSAGLGLPVLLLYLARQPLALVKMGEEYISFILLLTALYVISGGILLRGTFWGAEYTEYYTAPETYWIDLR